MSVVAAIDRVRTAPSIVQALQEAEALIVEARRGDGRSAVRPLAAALDDSDDVVVIAALHALAEAGNDAADAVLRDALFDARPFVREHAAEVLASRPADQRAAAELVRMVAGGGFTAMLAQRTLERWAVTLAAPLTGTLGDALLGHRDTAARTRLVETIGLVPGEAALRSLLAVAASGTEREPVRLAALAALGERPGSAEAAELLGRTAVGDDLPADVARLALADLASAPAAHDGGPTVAQLFLHADLDPGLDAAGRGDNGGIATLLVRLGDALARGPEVPRVLTLSRGTALDALAGLIAVSGGGSGHLYGRLPLGGEVASVDAWPLRIAARRGVRRLLRSAGRVDAIHLRMADVGTLVAAEVARELGIPVVFTLAPDPHAVIDLLERSGALRRDGFGTADLREHYWFRVRLVHRLAAEAAHLVLFPRPELERDLRVLLGVDLHRERDRISVVPEGIDLGAAHRAVEEVDAALATSTTLPALEELGSVLDALPAHRRSLPLLVTVGRLHRVKGMDRIVDAWLRHGLRHRANLLVVGGDLEHPSRDEQQQLDRIAELLPVAEQPTAGLLLTGSRPNDVVLRWLAAARLGVPGLAAPGGAYVCGSLKEEFGIALLEALAAGLRVVAPDGGGPATYVEQGVTGFLVDTADVEALGGAMAAVLDAGPSDEPDPAGTVPGRFSIEAMATTLGGIYRAVGAERWARAASAANGGAA